MDQFLKEASHVKMSKVELHIFSKSKDLDKSLNFPPVAHARGTHCNFEKAIDLTFSFDSV